MRRRGWRGFDEVREFADTTRELLRVCEHPDELREAGLRFVVAVDELMFGLRKVIREQEAAEVAAAAVRRQTWWDRNGRYVLGAAAIVFGLGLAAGFAAGLFAGLLL